jgi:hypothetical protein
MKGQGCSDKVFYILGADAFPNDEIGEKEENAAD